MGGAADAHPVGAARPAAARGHRPSTTDAPAPRRSPAAAGLPLATTYHLLRTCAHEGWLQRLDDGSYVLGHRIDVVRRPGDGGPRRRARPAGAGVAARRARRRGLPGPLRSTARSSSSRSSTAPGPPGSTCGSGCTTPGTPRRSASASLGQLPPGERRGLPEPAPAPGPDTEGPSSTAAGSRLPAPDQVAVDDGEYAVGVGCLAAAVVTPGRRRVRSGWWTRPVPARGAPGPCWPAPDGSGAP